MADVQHDGWANTGDKVVVYSGRSAIQARIVEVTRVTKTTIELSNGAKFRWARGSYEIPGRGTWDANPTVYPMDDPRVPGLLAAQRVRTARGNLDAAVSKFNTETGTAEEADAIVALASKLAEYVKKAGR